MNDVLQIKQKLIKHYEMQAKASRSVSEHLLATFRLSEQVEEPPNEHEHVDNIETNNSISQQVPHAVPEQLENQPVCSAGN